MANTKYIPGKVFGVWKIIEKTDEYKSNHPIYWVVNTITGNKKKMASNSIANAVKLKSKQDKIGRPRKWTYKVDENGFIIGKNKYTNPTNK